MLKAATSPEVGKRARIGKLMQDVTADGLRWAAAEAALLRAELVDFRRRMINAVIYSAVAFAALVAGLVILSQAAVAWTAAYIGSSIGAGLVFGAGLLVIAAVSAIAMRREFSKGNRSLLLRWLNAAADEPGSEP